MTRFRFRGHRGAQSASNTLKQQAYKDAKEASEKAHAEVEEKKKKEVKEDLNELSHKTYQDYRDKATSYAEKEDVESEAEAANSRRKTTWKKAFARKLSRKSGEKLATKKLGEQQEVNEFGPPAVTGALQSASEKYRKKKPEDVRGALKSAAERYRKQKEVKEAFGGPANAPTPKATKPRKQPKPEIVSQTVNKTVTSEEDVKPGFHLPEKYGGDHSVRKIYIDEARSGRSLGGAAHDTSYGGGLYGSVADSPVRAARASPRPAPRPVTKNVPPPVKNVPPVQRPVAPAPVQKQQPKAAPTPAPKPIAGTSNVPAGNVPAGSKHPAATPPGKGSAPSQIFNYAKTSSGGAAPPQKSATGPSPGIQPGQAKSDTYQSSVNRPEIKAQAPTGIPPGKGRPTPAPSGTIQPGQEKSAAYDAGVKRPEIKAAEPAFKGSGGPGLRPVSTYKPAYQASQTTKTDAGPTAAAISAPTSSTLPGVKSPGPTLSPIAKPGTPLPQSQTSTQTKTVPAPSTAPKSDVGPSSGPQTIKPSTAPKSDVGPTGSLSATSPELKSILSKDQDAGSQATLTPGLKTTPTPPAAQRQTIRKKVQDIAGPTYTPEEKILLPMGYGGDYSVRKIYHTDEQASSDALLNMKKPDVQKKFPGSTTTSTPSGGSTTSIPTDQINRSAGMSGQKQTTTTITNTSPGTSGEKPKTTVQKYKGDF